jgi:outer membrane lipopolysaccharide assembly protein LptE/RlpB
MIRKSVILVVLTLVLAGCGVYSFRGALPEGIESVAIPLMENRTSEPLLTEEITDQVINEFMVQNLFRLEDEERADGILEMVLKSVTEQANTYSSEESVSQMRLTLNVEVQLLRRTTGESVMKQNFNSWGVYSLEDGERGDGIEQAVNKLVEDITSALLSGW